MIIPDAKFYLDYKILDNNWNVCSNKLLQILKSLF